VDLVTLKIVNIAMIGNSKMLYYSQTCGIHVHIALSLFIKYQNNSRKSLDLLVNTKIIPEKKEKKMLSLF